MDVADAVATVMNTTAGGLPMVANAAIVLLICIGMGVFAYKKRVLDLPGSILSFFVGAIIGLIGDIYWLLALILFLAVTYGVTKMKYSIKKRMGVAQGRRGERGWRNVVANGAIPVAVVAMAPIIGFRFAAFLYITSVATAASDTFASEIGVFSRNDPILAVPPFKRVRKGIDGGVSPLGIGSSVLGSFLPTVFGFLLLGPLPAAYLPVLPHSHVYPNTAIAFFVPLLMGVLGAYIDSVLGAVFQIKGRMNNDQVNVVSIGITTILAVPLYVFI